MLGGNNLFDASVVIAAMVEANPIAARRMNQASTKYILGFTVLEIANALKHNSQSELLAERILKKLYSKKFVHIDFLPEDVVNATRVARDHRTTVYDALYHVVAMRLGMSFVTLDEAYYRKTFQLGSIKLITEAEPEAD